MFIYQFICALLLSLSVNFSVAAPDKVVCYVGSWSVYREGDGKFAIENIPPSLCTHLIYSFVTTTDDGNIKVMDPYADLTENNGKGGFSKLAALKKSSRSLKILVAMGGWNEGSEKYSKLFSKPNLRKTFALNAAAFLQKYGFDGLDIDWEYPAQRGGSPADVNNYVELLKTLREVFSKRGYLITAAVASGENSVAQSYNVPALGQYLDFINVMTYDIRGVWEGKTGHNSPLLVSKVEQTNGEKNLNIDASIQMWIRKGVPAKKLVMGVGFYGRSFTLSSQGCITPRCPSTGAGTPGQFTKEAGMLGYNEICLLEKNAILKWDDEAKVPYLISGNQWVSYDNDKSVKAKIDYIKKYNLGGAMVWSMDTDDFRGKCGRGPFPLLSALSKGINSK